MRKGRPIGFRRALNTRVAGVPAGTWQLAKTNSPATLPGSVDVSGVVMLDDDLGLADFMYKLDPKKVSPV